VRRGSAGAVPVRKNAPADGERSDLLLKNADMALYRAKEDGRRMFRFFEPGMDARLRARRVLELDLRNALAANEFELYYQPLVTLETGAISGFEALLRWHHPLRGMVAPAEFIPLAEEIGLIVPIGEWALRQSCAEAAVKYRANRDECDAEPVRKRKPLAEYNHAEHGHQCDTQFVDRRDLCGLSNL
jgi:predicted signal transduction protein with EAL and GGDEF domain